MNREIKFRFWDIEENEMFNWLDITPLHQEDFAFEGDLIAMQFTGLRDKNGKEIYEGDVYITEQGVKYKIMFINGCFVGGKNENNNAPLSWCLADYKKEIIRDDFHEEIEIIGNIYENPELL